MNAEVNDDTPPPAAAPIAEVQIQRLLERDGFARIEAPETRALLPRQAVEGFAAFARSWDDLGQDRFMADGGRYRRRRHAAFRVGPDGIARKPHQPHYQSRDYNMLNGGIERWFDPVESEVANGPVLPALIAFGHRAFAPLSPAPTADWHVEVHQFRIEAGAEGAGLPTPEGLHRDGVDWVLVTLIGRLNVEEGVTKIHGLDRREIGAFCLAEPLDTVLVDDHRIYHAVTPIVPTDAAGPACRDVLVITFRAA